MQCDTFVTHLIVWPGTLVYRAAKSMGISKDTFKQHLEAQAPNSRPGPSTVLPNLLPTVVDLHPQLGLGPLQQDYLMKGITYMSMNVIMNHSPGKPHICIIVHSNPCYGIFLFIQKYSLGKSLKCQYVTN